MEGIRKFPQDIGSAQDGATAARLTLLLAETEATDRLRVRRALEAAGLQAQIEEATTAAAAISRLRGAVFDCAILGKELPGGDALQVLRQVRDADVDTPIVVLTESGDEHVVVELMKAGASDCLAKSGLSAESLGQSLYAAIRERHAQARARSIARLRVRYLEQMQQLANAAVAINSAKTLPEMQATMTKQARRIVGAHQAMSTLRLPDAEASTCVSLSERYAEYRSLLTEADRFGIGRTVCDTNRPVRLTHAELAERAGWTAPDAGDDGKLPHRGWLAAPLVARSGGNIGVIHLSDRHQGEFSPEDEAVLVQLAQLASVAIENLRLYESARQAARAREQVLAIVSHDLRNPLNAVIMGSTLLLDTPLPPDQAKKQLATIRRAAESMNRMIQDLLDVIRMEAGRLTVATDAVAVHEVSREACDMLEPQARERNIALSCDVPDDLPAINADRDRILQVFSNLIGNAIKFTEPGGRVTLSARPAKGAVLFSVADTGSGIAPDHVARIFEPFWQAEQGGRAGAGLGLPITRGIIEAHGGQIRVESEAGRGSVFRFTVPMAEERQG